MFANIFRTQLRRIPRLQLQQRNPFHSFINRQPTFSRRILHGPRTREFSQSSRWGFRWTEELHQARRSSYQTFNSRAANTQHFLKRWAARPTFYLEVGGLAGTVGGVYMLNLEEVPISGRRRFNIISPDYEEEMGKQQYSQLLQQYRGRILPDSDARAAQVRRVLERLVPASGLVDKEWATHVVVSDEPNAFVLPSGKVFVFTGILPLCEGDQGLAAVLGHEIAHNVAHHAAEGMSQVAILILAAWLLELTIGVPGSLSQWILDFGFQKPGSRRQESEADYIGLMMMAESCFNPESAVQFWSRMEAHEQRGSVPPQLLSTHPSSHNRRTQMQQWLPEAMEKLNESGCGPLSGAANSFRSTVRQLR